MATLESLKGVGQASLRELKGAGIATLDDLMGYFPRDYEFRDRLVQFKDGFTFGAQQVKINTVCTVTGQEYFGQTFKQTLKITVSDGTGYASLICFGRNFLANTLKVGRKIFLSGVFQVRFGELQSSNFDYELWSENPQFFGKILPIYPLSGKLTQNFLRKSVMQAYTLQGQYEENIIPEKLRQLNGLMDRKEAIRNIHFPESKEKLEDAIRTLKYEEILLFEQNIKEAVKKRKVVKKRTIKLPRELQRKVAASLPFMPRRARTHRRDGSSIVPKGQGTLRHTLQYGILPKQKRTGASCHRKDFFYKQEEQKDYP